MRTVRPKKQGKEPGVDIDYGNPVNPRKVYIQTKQVQFSVGAVGDLALIYEGLYTKD